MSTDTSLPDVRTRLVEAAIRLLATNGPSEVKARSVASEAGLSTMGVYTHLGGVPELLQAVADEGFKRLTSVFVRVTATENPITDLCTMVLACRDFARSNPHLYDLMFGLSIEGRYSPSRCPTTPVAGGHSAAFKVTYAVLVKTCTRLVEAKHVRKIDPALIALQLWSAAHGFIMLELAGQFAGVANPPAEILVPMCNNVVVGMGATRARAESSTADVIAGWADREKN
ncbi:TetR/AcrR family transcriptional regulator [Pseudomonas sp. 2FG]|uniref:TetR/AcrR family transcriptional regulator n=1 Tax=Pseudomonas sp. 2FG TaxID=2502191 RepID=UPI0010F5D4B7|nr:TetR/AcrR family transcriptional regulator [Pseudomonas sp. 2FG]